MFQPRVTGSARITPRPASTDCGRHAPNSISIVSRIPASVLKPVPGVRRSWLGQFVHQPRSGASATTSSV